MRGYPGRQDDENSNSPLSSSVSSREARAQMEMHGMYRVVQQAKVAKTAVHRQLAS